MSDLLLELFSEEIPARMQRRAASDLGRLIRERLDKFSLSFDDLSTEVTPRRLTLTATGLPSAQPDTVTERKGPKVGAPDKAVQGFLSSTKMTLDQCEQRETPKGTFYFAVIRNQGRPTADVLPEIIEEAINVLSWPKSMRWGSRSIRWVRPLHSILCLFDGQTLDLSFGGIQSGNTTAGHRFMASDRFAVSGIDDYRKRLQEAKVVLSSEERASSIARDAEKLVSDSGLSLKSDPGLIEECAGLVEYPVVLMGSIDEEFMALPPEILSTAMRSHQKYFSVLKSDGSLAPQFVVVSNMEAADGGKAIVSGNERVLRARLADAKFFWDTDLKNKLESRVEKLSSIVFQAKLGENADRLSHKVERIKALGGRIAELSNIDPSSVGRAAELCKADLVSDVVYEFPELQGLMGKYYARHDGEPEDVCVAIEEHYAPQGPSDRCPSAPLSCAVALADKIDTLVGFFAIDEKPTGSKDPFALRRAALGVLRILVENRLRLPLCQIFDASSSTYPDGFLRGEAGELSRELLVFFADRLKVYLKDQGIRHDLITAVFAAKPDDDFVRLIDKVKALSEFLSSDDGPNLLAGYRRAANIVRIEEKKDGRRYDQAPDPSQLIEDHERELATLLGTASSDIEKALEKEAFADAMASLSKLRSPIDRFFDEVQVNADDATVRENRLRLLATIRAALDTIADFSQVEG